MANRERPKLISSSSFRAAGAPEGRGSSAAAPQPVLRGAPAPGPGARPSIKSLQRRRRSPRRRCSDLRLSTLLMIVDDRYFASSAPRTSPIAACRSTRDRRRLRGRPRRPRPHEPVIRRVRVRLLLEHVGARGQLARAGPAGLREPARRARRTGPHHPTTRCMRSRARS